MDVLPAQQACIIVPQPQPGHVHVSRQILFIYGNFLSMLSAFSVLMYLFDLCLNVTGHRHLRELLEWRARFF